MLRILSHLVLALALTAGLFACADGKTNKARPCGNGVLDPNEQCDDFNSLPDDGCSASCEWEEGWDCGDALPTLCLAICGDGRVVGLEPCDDGAMEPGDGCAADCTVETGWTCEAMPSVCITTCGDGARAPGIEACDDGNRTPGDGCSADASSLEEMKKTCTVGEFHFTALSG
jgi:cysteine-rich repeat protein